MHGDNKAVAEDTSHGAGSTENHFNPLCNADSHLEISHQKLQDQLLKAGCVDLQDVVVPPSWYQDESIAPYMSLVPIGLLKEHMLGAADIQQLHKSHHPDPFSILGSHLIACTEKPTIVVRVWHKDAAEISIGLRQGYGAIFEQEDEPVKLTRTSDWLFEGMFEVRLLDKTKVIAGNLSYYIVVNYQKGSTESYIKHDPYCFPICTSDYDLKNFISGHCWHVDNILGSHIVKFKGVTGVRFAVWAPNALFVSVLGEWNQWDGRANPMRKRHDYGVWELFIACAKPGMTYGYKLHSKQKCDSVKIDPFAQEYENPPAYASIISNCDDPYKPTNDRFKWSDERWLAKREYSATADGVANIHRLPMSIYEVHLPSWMRGDNNSYLSYRDVADPLVKHLKKMNFTHVEFLPLAHHPFEGSWGYQVSGSYAPYSRLGSADDLKYLINELHLNNIGVFVDFVPAHFCKDDWGLARFDGQPLYEYSDPREGEHYGWGTYVYNFGRPEVRSFLLGAAYHWIRRYHIDGLRIDAVSAMIYKNYCRKDGQWIPNEYGGDANLQAISLLQEMNWVVRQNYPGVFMMAEESTSWKGVTDKDKGLGFDAKWDLGWMNDTLAYTTTPKHLRAGKHTKLTFRGLYVGHENWILPLSHDEVVSGKGSLLDKMGFEGVHFNERMRMLRAVFGFQITIPGRPLLFMGSEFGQGREWHNTRSLDWHEYEEPLRRQCAKYLADLLLLYKEEKALHAGDSEGWNYKWVCADSCQENLIAYIRSYGEWNNDILVVVNFNIDNRMRFPLGVPHGGDWTVLMNSDDWQYGGSMNGPGVGVKQTTTQGGVLGWPYCLWLDIPGNSCLILKSPRPVMSLGVVH